MQIGAVGMSFRPYIYNTNTVSANSLNKISAIEDDALKSSVDYSNGRNENPLKAGQTANFADVLAMQMQLGQNNAARILKPAQQAQETDGVVSEIQTPGNAADAAAAQQIPAVEETDEEAAAGFGQGFRQSVPSAYMMSRAIDAYAMAMAG